LPGKIVTQTAFQGQSEIAHVYFSRELIGLPSRE